MKVPGEPSAGTPTRSQPTTPSEFLFEINKVFATSPGQFAHSAFSYGGACSIADMHLNIRTARWLAHRHGYPEIKGWCDAMVHLPPFIVAVACRAPSPLYCALKHGRVDPDECAATSTLFGPFFAHFSSSTPPRTRRVLYPAWCLCLLDADWCLHFNAMPDSRLQVSRTSVLRSLCRPRTRCGPARPARTT